MSVLDRVHRSPSRQDGDLPSTDKSSTSLAAEQSPVVFRLRIVMKQLATAAQNGPNAKYSRWAWVLDGMLDEILDELMPDDPEIVGQWFEQFAHIIEWCGSGNDDVLPDSVRPYLAQRQREMLAITAGDNH